MNVSPQTKAMILKDMASPFADIGKVSNTYQVPIRIIRELMAENQPVVSTGREIYGGLGRPSLQQYIVARTRAGNRWPAEKTEEIQAARNAYDAGLIDMATGRDGDWLILYAIPRKRPDRKRQIYFARSFY